MESLLKLIYTLGKNLHNEITIRQLSKEAKVPYTTAYRLISQNNSLLKINKKGNIKLCSLNTENNIVKNYLILAERSQVELFKKKNPLFKVLQRELSVGDYTLVLFGSRADGTQRKQSDVDFCVINQNGKKHISFSKFELLFKMEVNALFFTRKEFKLMLKDKEHNVGKEILKNHIILHGEEYFWNLVWKYDV